MYIKAFDKDLRGSESFQFEVGKTYTTKADNPVVWFHYGDKATTALCFYPKEDTRFCIVEPLGEDAYAVSSPMCHGEKLCHRCHQDREGTLP